MIIRGMPSSSVKVPRISVMRRLGSGPSKPVTAVLPRATMILGWMMLNCALR